MSGIRNRTHLACWVAVCGALLAGGAWADDRYVSPSGSDAGDGSPGAPWASIAHGVDQMASGTLWLLPGSHTLTGEVVVAKAIVIRSQSGQADDTRVVGGGASRCFHLAGAQSGLRGLTVTNGQAGALAGGGILITGAGASVIDGIVSGCSGKDGGGVYLHASAAAGVVSNCLVRGNRAVSGAGGGVYLAGGVLASSRIEANLACSGGGVRAAGGRVVACVIDGNRTTRGLADAIQVIQVGDRDYAVHQYTRAGEAAFTPVSGVTNVEYLIVAGGGGGGLKSSTAGGGGGAGGMLTGVVAVTPETVYDVRVGHGGTGCVNGVQGFGGDGGPSRFAGIEATGGGGGQGLADTDGTQGRNGGSGGGGSRFNPGNSYPGGSGIAGQGHNGGAGAGIQSWTPSLRSFAGGGGGGAGGPGDSTTGYPDSPPGHGGLGRYCGITGANVPYAGGGGGGGTSATRGLGGLGGGGDGAIDTGDAQDGEPGTGGGGGGTRSGGSGSSGSGGSGIVVIRHAMPAGMTLGDLLQELNASIEPGGTGAGIFADNGAEILACTISGNGQADAGGGIYLGPLLVAPCQVESCLIVSNQAMTAGAGVYLHAEAGDSQVGDSVIRWNRTIERRFGAITGGRGGGVFLAGGSVSACLIADNASAQGGGAYGEGGTLVNSIVRDNANRLGTVDSIEKITVDDQDYVVLAYTRVGESIFAPPAGVSAVDYLVVAGGGSGGLSGSAYGGGGGAGGMLTGVVSVASGTSYPVKVGTGGGRIGNGVAGVAAQGEDGGSSLFHTIEVTGGGGGGRHTSPASSGRVGGSGGGGTLWSATYSASGGQGIAGQGHAGGRGQGQVKIDGVTQSGRAGGGGGGAGGPGATTDGSTSVRGNGGTGVYSSITGVLTPYAGGGGGGGVATTRGNGGVGGGGTGGTGNSVSGQDGLPSTGGGGGGAGAGGIAVSGAGGSGIVIIRYAWPAGLAEADLIDLQVGSVPGGTGGGAQAGGTLTLRNCLIVGNQDADRGGGLYVGDATAQSSVVIESCTIADNTAADLGAGLYLEGLGDDEVWNTIIYDNVGDDVQADGSATNRIWYSCLPDVMPDPNCITTAPRFVSADDFRLKLASPCVDAGINRDWMADALDLAGGYRIDRQVGRVDMGCYEYTARSTIILLR